MATAKVPYDARGDMRTSIPERLEGESEENYKARVQWRDNIPFQTTMALVGHDRKGASAHYTFVDQKGHLFQMFMKDLADMILKTDIHLGVVSGTWAIVKRGQYYGLQFIE